jgi:adenosine 3'-phospho 5'-phosphosulfate transporter B2
MDAETMETVATKIGPIQPLAYRLGQQVLMNLMVLVPLCLFESWFYQRDLKREWGYFGVTSSNTSEEKLAHDSAVKFEPATSDATSARGGAEDGNQALATIAPTAAPPVLAVEDDNGKTKHWVRGKLLICALGLIGYHLLWGLFQERLVRTEYAEGKRFSYSTFLVFCSRFSGMLVSGLILRCFKPSNTTSQPAAATSASGILPTRLGDASVLKSFLLPPLIVFSPPSLSNTLSSWCQLEALQYTSFPAQVMMKTFKLVPLVVMGTMMGKKYPFHEYLICIIVGLGITLFVDGVHESNNSEVTTVLDGDLDRELAVIFLKVLYLVSDSFTAQWQETIFKGYQLSSYQMMLGMNICSSSLALISMILSHEFYGAMKFLYANPLAIWHIVGFSISGAIGQIFIFETIKEFGAVTFALITTTRQMIAVLLSIIVFGHTVTSLGWMGCFAAFAALIIRFMLITLSFPSLPSVSSLFGSGASSNQPGDIRPVARTITRRYRKVETDDF